MAHGLSTGWVEWGGQRYEFVDAPSYVEKNWGGGFPKKWFWAQCNTFDGMPKLRQVPCASFVADRGFAVAPRSRHRPEIFSCPTCSLTTGGGRRALPLLNNEEEDVAMIGIHVEGTFIELVPWRGTVEVRLLACSARQEGPGRASLLLSSVPPQWEISPWGSWKVRGDNGHYRAEVEATALPTDGTPLRAPTLNDGLAPFCKDTFHGKVRLRVWDLRRNTTVPWVDATSDTCALEVGGGPWWSSWKAKAEMKEPLRSMLQLPIEPSPLTDFLPNDLRPPGL